MGKKLLFVASTAAHIRKFHLPYLHQLKAEGWELHAACSGSGEGIPHTDQVLEIPFRKRMFSPEILKAAWLLRKKIQVERYTAIIVHTSLAAFFSRLAVLGLKSRPKVVNMVHGYLFDDRTPWLKRSILLAAEKLTAPVTDLLITMNGEEYNGEKIIAELGLPLFVKPNASGSSFGVTRVTKAEELHKAVELAFTESDEILIEECITGREMGCGVMIAGGKEYIFPITEIIAKNAFFDYEAKYTAGMSEEITPADITEEVKRELNRMTLEAYRTCRCSGVVRVDFIVTEEGKPYFIELNSIPGMSGGSIVPKQAREMGISLGELYDIIIRDKYGWLLETKIYNTEISSEYVSCYEIETWEYDISGNIASHQNGTNCADYIPSGIVYKYDADRNIKTEIVPIEGGTSCTTEGTDTITYKYISFDKYGNWTKRECRNKGKLYDDCNEYGESTDEGKTTWHDFIYEETCERVYDDYGNWVKMTIKRKATDNKKDNYYNEEDEPFNLERMEYTDPKDQESWKFISHINKLRKNQVYLDNTEAEYLFITTNYKDEDYLTDKLKEKRGLEYVCDYAVNLDRITNIIWYKLGNGFGKKDYPSNVSVILNARIAIAASIAHNVERVYAEAKEQFKIIIKVLIFKFFDYFFMTIISIF